VAKINIELSDEQMWSIKRCFRQARFNDPERIASELAQLAVSSWIDWLAGAKRYTSLTEQHADWLEAIYVHLLPDDEAPAVDRVYNSFNVPYGQAQYISRVLSEKALTRWRRRAADALKLAMEAKLADVNVWIERGDTEANAEIIIDRLAYLELRIIVERLFKRNPDDISPPQVRSAANVYSIRIPAICFRRIYDELASLS
jgi:hypothetical protein